MTLRSTRTAVATAICSAALLGAAPAEAVVYQGTWDPEFGSQFPNSGWRATARLTVPDACALAAGLGAVSLDYTNFGSVAGCSGVQVTDATLFLYALGDPTKTTVWSNNFGTYIPQATPALYGTDAFTQEVESVDLVDGLPTAFTTTGSALVTAPNALDLTSIYYLSLHLSTDPNKAYLLYGAADGANPSTASKTTGLPTVTFERVPEPASLPLVGLALAAVWGGTRARVRSLRKRSDSAVA
jgi:hypothetical protein